MKRHAYVTEAALLALVVCSAKGKTEGKADGKP